MNRPLPASTPPAALVFGLFDPTGKYDLPGDSVTCAAHHVHALSVLTGISIADSSGMFALERLGADDIDEQARCLLEDMPIKAIKVGLVPAPETAGAIAGIAADYSDAPLVLDLPAPRGPSAEHPDAEVDFDGIDPCVGAVLELLVPQARVVVMSAAASHHWLNEDVLRQLDSNDDVNPLLSLGAQWTLTTHFVQRPGSMVHLLQGPEGETIALPCPPTPNRGQELTGLIASALACHLAHGHELVQAVQWACDYAQRCGDDAFQAGMGQRLAKRWVTAGSQ
jgi:hydroxymethylpyrimidine/phosphomethylpyrimidine kinase